MTKTRGNPWPYDENPLRKSGVSALPVAKRTPCGMLAGSLVVPCSKSGRVPSLIAIEREVPGEWSPGCSYRGACCHYYFSGA